MKAKIILPNSAVLWKYPKLLASLLYGQCNIEEITTRVVEFAQTYDDTAYFVTRIKKIIPYVLSQQESKPIDRKLSINLGGLAFETQGAAIEWYLREGKDADEALLIWLVHLCHCDPEDSKQYTAGLDVAFQEIGGYALRNRGHKALPLLQAATYDFILAYSWEEFLMAAFSHISTSVAMGLQHLTQNAIEAKLREGNGYSNFERYFLCFQKEIGDNLAHWCKMLDYGGPLDAEFTNIRTEFDNLFEWLSKKFS